MKQKKHSHHKFTMTYDGEVELLKGVIGSVRGKPQTLKKLSTSTITTLAYIFMGKVANDPVIEGFKVIEKQVTTRSGQSPT